MCLFLPNYAKAQQGRVLIKHSKNQPSPVPFNDDSGLFPDRYGIYKQPEKFPMFPGGSKAYNSYVKKHLKWPSGARSIDVQGKVHISFVVEKNGILTNFKVTKKLQPLFDASALQTVKQMPRWLPGRVNRKAVRCYYTLSFDFSFED